MGDLLNAKSGYELTFRVRLELAGKEPPTEAAVAGINAVLKKVNDDIQVK